MDYLEHPNNTGFLDPSILRVYGLYGWFERLKLGGVGSSKVLYKSGLPFFDDLIFDRTDLPMVNFELLKKALLMRLSIHNECYTVAILKENLSAIYLSNHSLNKDLIVVVKEPAGNYKMVFDLVGNQKSLKNFFSKAYFKDILHF